MPKSMPDKKNQTAAALARGTCVTASLGASLPSAQTAAALPHTPSATHSVLALHVNFTRHDRRELFPPSCRKRISARVCSIAFSFALCSVHYWCSQGRRGCHSRTARIVDRIGVLLVARDPLHPQVYIQCSSSASQSLVLLSCLSRPPQARASPLPLTPPGLAERARASVSKSVRSKGVGGHAPAGSSQCAQLRAHAAQIHSAATNAVEPVARRYVRMSIVSS
jgi:hypothetical protein